MPIFEAGMQQTAQLLNKTVVRGLSGFLVNEKLPVETARKRFMQLNRFVRPLSDVAIQETELAGVPVEILTPEQTLGNRSMLYLHGGGFCVGSPKTHRELTMWLAKTLQCKVIVPDYRLAPEHPFPAGLNDCLAVYDVMLEQGADPSELVMAGDSAGGNLVLVSLLKLRDQHKPMPAAVVLYSPWTDLRCCSESYYTKRDLDPLLTGPWLRRMREYYRGGLDVHRPDLSPLLGDLKGLPPMLIHVGGNEVLLNDSLNLDTRLRACQGDVHLKVWHELWHVFHAHVQYLDIARQAIFETRDFVNQIINIQANEN